MNLFSRLFKSEPKQVREFSLDAGVRIYAVGDVHGRAGLLRKMLRAIAQDARNHPNHKIIEVFLGDYIDRGLESREVINLLLSPPPQGHQRICLLGNHEETLLRFLDNPNILRDWRNYGGFATLDSYGVGIPASMSPEKLNILRDAFQRNLPAAHLAFIKSLPLTYVNGDYLFVHAGVPPHLPLHEQKPEHLLWIRDKFLYHSDFFDHYVVHGHSPMKAPDIQHNRANIDISVAEKNSLCCMVITGSERRVFVVEE